MDNDDTIPLDQKLHLETGKITWPELQRYFARGVLVIVASQLDLLQVAKHIANDQAVEIEQMIQQGHLIRATDAHARDWQARDALFWAVVISPWVLVQEISP